MLKIKFQVFGIAWLSINSAAAQTYITDPITNYYNIHIINQTNQDINVLGSNLGQTFWVNGNRLFRDGTGIIINMPRYATVPAQQQRVFNVVVKNYKPGVLNFRPLEPSGTSFQIMQTNNPNGRNIKNCVLTQVLPKFVCIEDTSPANSLATVSLVQNQIFVQAQWSEVDLYLQINPRSGTDTKRHSREIYSEFQG